MSNFGTHLDFTTFEEFDAYRDLLEREGKFYSCFMDKVKGKFWIEIA